MENLRQCIEMLIKDNDYSIGGMSNNVTTFIGKDCTITGADNERGFSVDVSYNHASRGNVRGISITQNKQSSYSSCTDTVPEFWFLKTNGEKLGNVIIRDDSILINNWETGADSLEWRIDGTSLELVHRNDAFGRRYEDANFSDWSIEKIVNKIYDLIIQSIGSWNCVEEFNKIFDTVKPVLTLVIIEFIKNRWVEAVSTKIETARKNGESITQLSEELERIKRDISHEYAMVYLGKSINPLDKEIATSIITNQKMMSFRKNTWCSYYANREQNLSFTYDDKQFDLNLKCHQEDGKEYGLRIERVTDSDGTVICFSFRLSNDDENNIPIYIVCDKKLGYHIEIDDLKFGLIDGNQERPVFAINLPDGQHTFDRIEDYGIDNIIEEILKKIRSHNLTEEQIKSFDELFSIVAPALSVAISEWKKWMYAVISNYIRAKRYATSSEKTSEGTNK